jgi:transcription factor TFIIIB component B''
MQTLARMTGKDFSGPTPEIRAPAVLSLAEPESNVKTSEPRVLDQAVALSSTTSELGEEEVVGEISSFDPE